MGADFSEAATRVGDDIPISNLVELLRELNLRLTRVESICRLWLAPLRGAKWTEATRDSIETWLTNHPDWECLLDRSWRHVESCVIVTMHHYTGDGLGFELPEALLAIAAVEDRTPRDLLLEIAPSAFPTAVDALGAITQDD